MGKLLEQLAHLLRRHADAGVGHRQRDPVAAVLLSLVSGDGDRSLLRELIGVDFLDRCIGAVVGRLGVASVSLTLSKGIQDGGTSTMPRRRNIGNRLRVP